MYQMVQNEFKSIEAKMVRNNMNTQTTDHNREAIDEGANPLGMEGIEFIEYATSKPQQLGQILETMGFRPIARHRSREVLLYRQGGINVIVNAHGQNSKDDGSLDAQLSERPVIAAIAIRVRDASAAYKRALDRGAWAIPANAEVMELNIPAVHGVGNNRIYFVDRHKEFSIYDVDFTPIPTVDQHPPAIAGLHFLALFSTLATSVPKIGPSFTVSCLASPNCPAHSVLASCPKDEFCVARAAINSIFTCN